MVVAMAEDMVVRAGGMVVRAEDMVGMAGDSFDPEDRGQLCLGRVVVDRVVGGW